jgi:hypothetical protein
MWFKIHTFKIEIKVFYTVILILNHVVLILNISHVHSFTNFCNISMYLFFATHIPEDGHTSGRNMQVVLLRL